MAVIMIKHDEECKNEMFINNKFIEAAMKYSYFFINNKFIEAVINDS